MLSESSSSCCSRAQLAKPIDPDSDEEPLAAINSSGPSAEERAQAKADAFEAEIDIVRQRIANARLSAPDGELEKLQDRQRERIERLNSYRSQAGDSGSGSGHGRGAMDDLRDLRFDDPAPPSR